MQAEAVVSKKQSFWRQYFIKLICCIALSILNNELKILICFSANRHYYCNLRPIVLIYLHISRFHRSAHYLFKSTMIIMLLQHLLLT
jgi:hypothetical protein